MVGYSEAVVNKNGLNTTYGKRVFWETKRWKRMPAIEIDVRFAREFSANHGLIDNMEKYIIKSWHVPFFWMQNKKLAPSFHPFSTHRCAKQTEHLHGTPFRYFHGRIRTETQEAKHAHTQQKDSAHQHDGVIGASANPEGPWWRAKGVCFGKAACFKEIKRGVDLAFFFALSKKLLMSTISIFTKWFTPRKATVAKSPFSDGSSCHDLLPDKPGHSWLDNPRFFVASKVLLTIDKPFVDLNLLVSLRAMSFLSLKG